jgi:hypothetical protein
MTVTEILDYVKRLQTENVAQTPFWSDLELYSLLERKCNEVLGIIGLIEGKDTSLTSTSGTQDYTIPTGFVNLRRVYYNGQPLKYLNFRQFESRSPSGTAPSGTPREWTMWGSLISLVPTPSVSSDTITVYGEKTQSSITSSSSTVDIPAVFHGALCDAMLADMFVKDLNGNMATFYQNKWIQFHVPMMKEFAKRRRRRGLPTVVIDADSVLETEFGII